MDTIKTKRIVDARMMRAVSSATTVTRGVQVDPRAAAARSAEVQLRAALQESNRTHIGRMGRAA
jgi:hypothetical protein